jgi:hypothetical protein
MRTLTLDHDTEFDTLDAFVRMADADRELEPRELDDRDLHDDSRFLDEGCPNGGDR